MEIVNMEAKELKKLSRSELLEMLLDRSKEVEHLRKELDETKKYIQTLEREVKTSGDINAHVSNRGNPEICCCNIHGFK
jgi:5-bromo-4-chloroindolyl phosphate hydrolysis protein